jgi:hypothetical protein
LQKILTLKKCKPVYVECEDVTSSDRIQSKLGYECLLAFNDKLKQDILKKKKDNDFRFFSKNKLFIPE